MIWKLLRQHVSVGQLTGFFVANLLGLIIVLAGFQFYRDISPVFMGEDGFLKSDYVIVSKQISSMGGLSGSEVVTFSQQEMEEMSAQPFAKGMGQFTSSQYQVSCAMGMEGVAQFGTEMFFESVPDRFVDVNDSQWTWSEEQEVTADVTVPIILPRSYLALYNFGFAQSRSLPKMSESVISMINMVITLRGNGLEDRLQGRVIGFSNRLNTILVPESFMRWSNERYAPEAEQAVTRLILEVHNPADDRIVTYMQDHGYEIDSDKLEAGKTMFFLRVVVGLVMGVGLLISALSFYILLLSIYLLVQKNTVKLQNLLLIGYSPARVALPYQILTISLTCMVYILALMAMLGLRSWYMNTLWSMFPEIQDTGIVASVVLGAVTIVCVSILNIIIIRRKIYSLWRIS